MGLAKLQGVLARLYTDAGLRERFFADPQTVGEALGLSDEESQQLAQLSAQQVNFFADSLKRKRLNEACKLMPLTHRVLGKRFGALFRRYADTHVPRGTKKHLEDALAFSAFVEQASPIKGIERWTVDLLRYEAAWLKAWDPTCRWILRWFQHPVAKLVHRLEMENEVPLPRAKPTIAFWFRLSPRGRLCHFVLSLPLLRPSRFNHSHRLALRTTCRLEELA